MSYKHTTQANTWYGNPASFKLEVTNFPFRIFEEVFLRNLYCTS